MIEVGMGPNRISHIAPLASFLLVGVLLSSSIAISLGQTPALVRLSPSTLTVRRGDQFGGSVTVDPGGRGVSGGEISLSFNSSAFEIVSVTPGTLLGTDPLEGVKQIDNSAGTLRYALARRGGTVPPTPQGTFASMAFKTRTSASKGTYSIVLTGAGLCDESFNDIPLTTANDLLAVTIEDVFDFSLSNSGGFSVTQGGSGSNTITVTLISGTTQVVSLSASGLPSGASASFNPASGNPTFTGTCSISTSSSTPTGPYTIIVTGTGGGKTRTTQFTLTVNAPATFDFSLNNNGGVTVTQGSSGSNTITVTLTSGTGQTVALLASGLPSGASASFNPASGTPTFSSTCAISTSSSTPTGSYTITVTGSGGGLTRTTSFTLTVNAPPLVFDFSLSNSGGITVNQGNSGSNTITVGLVSGSTQSVSLSASGLPSGATSSFNPTSGNPTYSSTCTISTSSSTPTGSYTVTVTGTGGGKTHTTQFSLTVNAPQPVFDFSLTSSGGFSVTQGGSGSNTIIVTLISGTTQPVSLSASGLPSGASASFSSASGSPTFTSTLTVSTSPSTPTGSHTITVTGTGGGLTRTTTLTLTVNPRSQLGTTRIVLDASPKPGYVNKPVAISGVMYGSWRRIKGVVAGAPVEITTSWGFRTNATTDDQGQFSATTTCPSTGGTYQITAKFYEAEDLTAASTTITYQVIAKIETSITISFIANKEFAGYLTRKDTGAYLANKPVKLTVHYLSGTTWQTTTFDLQTRQDGYYSLEFLFYWNSATITFEGDETFAASTATITR